MNIKQTISITLILLLILGAYIFLKQPEKVHPEFYKHLECIELADTPEKMLKGLMWRTDLCDNCGMLFVLEPGKQIRMWMKNTPTSLDMIFIDKHGVIVTIFTHTTPFQEFPMYQASKKVSYVLEMKAGFADREMLKPGLQVDVSRLQGCERR